MLREQEKAGFRFKEFSSLDTSSEADYLISSMDVMLSLNSIQAIKQRAIAAMQLKVGATALEVGCGTGEDAERLGEWVGETGTVVAIDISQRMLAEAKRRSKLANIEYRIGDANHLDFLDNTFSGCHADRLLVSHDNYCTFLKEIVRVVKPGGVICFTDVDALSIILTPYNATTKIILEQLHQSFVNLTIGRLLPELFVQQGLQNIIIIPETSMIRCFTTLSKIFQFPSVVQEAVKQGKLTEKAAKQWFIDMYKAEQEGYFLYCITLFTVLGYVPE